jgi:WD40 repeat protein
MGKAYSQLVHGMSALSPDGKSAAFLVVDRGDLLHDIVVKDNHYDILIKDISTEAVIKKFAFDVTGFQMFCLAYSPDGAWLGVRSDKAFRIYNVHTEEVISMQVAESNENKYCFAFSPDNQTLATGHLNGSVKVWNFRTGALLQELQYHTCLITNLAYSEDGQRLASGDHWNEKIVIWDVSSGNVLKTRTGTLFKPQIQLALSDSVSDVWFNFGSRQWWSDGYCMFQIPTRLMNAKVDPFTSNGHDLKFFTSEIPCRLVNLVVCLMMDSFTF